MPHRFVWDIDGVVVHGSSSDTPIAQRWAASFASRRATDRAVAPDLRVHLDRAENVPPVPADLPEHQGSSDLIAYYGSRERVIAHLPGFSQLTLDLSTGSTTGVMVDAALSTSGVFEDLVAVALAPHLRRRQRYFVHAFAAALEGRAVLLVGDIGAGKTTTGLAALRAGWQILSNDSPLVRPDGRVGAYPGLVSAYPETLERLGLGSVVVGAVRPGQKATFAVETVWPRAWADEADVAAVCFPSIEARAGHALDLLSPAETLVRLLPHSVERWDTATTDAHLAVLRELCDRAPGYALRLAPDIASVPDVLGEAASR